MVYEHDSFFGQLALRVGLPTPVPDRWDTVSDEVLEQYILGFGRILDDPTVDDREKTGIVRVFNEHIKARDKKYFDVVADYYQRADKITTSQLFFTLEKMCGSAVSMADKMLEVYTIDPRWYKNYFYIYFAEKGTQKHWDAIANDATTTDDIELLERLAISRKRQLDKHGVNPWIPEPPANNPK